MKNLYLAILLLAFATNLSAFDKVWELQFSSTPHHVHYTEGHKELIVGEGNTFKKYNAETGALIDSVVYSLDALKDYTIGEFHVTDDLKSLYISTKLKDVYEIIKLDIPNKTFKSIDKLTQSGSLEINMSRHLLQISDKKFIKFTTNRYWGLSGNVILLNADSSSTIESYNNNSVNINSYNNSLIMLGMNGEVGIKGEQIRTYSQKYYSIPENKFYSFKNSANVNILSTTSKYIYSLNTEFNEINREDFRSSSISKLKINANNIYTANRDIDLFVKTNSKIYHLNFDFNEILDSMDYKDNQKSCFTNYSNNLFSVIDSNAHTISTYKSDNKISPKMSINYDSITISVGDTIVIKSVKNLLPNSDKWDLADGRILNGDSIYVSYAKKGEYNVSYSAIYKDTTITNYCKVIVLDTFNIELSSKVQIKEGYTELTIEMTLKGDYSKVQIGLSPRIYTYPFIDTNHYYKSYDSTNNKLIYKIFKDDIYNFQVYLSNKIRTKDIIQTYFIPVNKIKGLEYILSPKRAYNIDIIDSTESIIYYDNNHYFTNQQRVYAGRDYYDAADFYFNSLLATHNSNYEFKYIVNERKYLGFGEIYQTGLSLQYYVFNKLYDSNPKLYGDVLNEKLFFLFDNLTLDSFNLKNFRDFKELDIVKIDNKYLFNANNGHTHYLYLLNTNTHEIENTNINYTLPFYGGIVKKYEDKYYLLSTKNVIKLYEISKELNLVDSLKEISYKQLISKSMKGNYAYCLIKADTNNVVALKQIKLKSNVVKDIDLNNNNYHQVYQLNDSISCLVSTKDSNLVISTFKNDNASKKVDFNMPISLTYKIFKVSKNNELFLKYKSNESSTSLVKTKGFASIIDSLSKQLSDDSTSNPIDTTINKGIIQSSENQFATVIQDQDFKVAKIYFKDSLDLSNSFVKIYTETGDEILTYSLSKDQKDLLIQTDKLYIGTYYVRILNKNEEHNLGKFIIVR